MGVINASNKILDMQILRYNLIINLSERVRNKEELTS